jgi:uncharacterized protein DUF222/HNH endonuclease
VGSLRSALDQLGAQELRDLSDRELSEHLVELERAVRVIEAERARALGEVEARRSYATDGSLSLTSFLAHTTGVPASVAAQQARLSRSLPQMPRTRAALTDGAISLSAALLLAAAWQDDAEGFARCEEPLVRAARTLPHRDLRRAIEYWRLLADTESADGAARRRFERRGLYVSSTIDGMVRVDGDLDPETGQVVVTAIRCVVDAASRGADEDERRPAQRRADALEEICRRYLDAADRPVVAGERPHLVLTVDVAALTNRHAGAELEAGGPVDPETARRLACDARVSRIVTSGGSEPLDVGRQTAIVPAPLRRAVLVRDRGCRFPGCDRPPGWCDAHHVVHWADGGPTSLANLLLLCRRHHRLVHDRFSVEMVDGRPLFRRADGSILEDRAPPVAV